MEMGLIVLTNGIDCGGGPPKQKQHASLLNLPHNHTCLDTFPSCGNLHMQNRGLPDVVRYVGLSNMRKGDEYKSDGCC